MCELEAAQVCQLAQSLRQPTKLVVAAVKQLEGPQVGRAGRQLPQAIAGH